MKSTLITQDRTSQEDNILQAPKTRMRRLRSSAALRSMVRESHLRLDQLIAPLFIAEGKGEKNPIASMPEVYQHSVDAVCREVEVLAERGIKAVLLFGIPGFKDTEASSAWQENGVVQRATKEIKSRFPEMLVIADTCLCEYMSHGHCGIVADGKILNDPTLTILARTAVSQAAAGADIIAPSDMMDGNVQAIRQALDNAGYHDLPIMAYSAKFASALYGPFREAAQSAPQFGDRTTYQMDSANGREALAEIELDVNQGADMLVIKPPFPIWIS